MSSLTTPAKTRETDEAVPILEADTKRALRKDDDEDDDLDAWFIDPG